jgi:hypothetical protein
MSIINAIYDYISTCPLLKPYGDYTTVYVDYSKDDEATTYSVNAVPCNPVIKTYITGDTVNQFLFTLSSVENYSADMNVNTANISFYEQFNKWIRENNKNGIFPTLGEDQEATKIECLTGGYMFANSASGATSRYVIQCKLTYDQSN